MWATRVGYAGGTTPSPTYRSIGDHTECFQVDFDPKVISYADLLGVFWTSHDPTSTAYSTQYESLILAADDAQLATARVSRDRFEAVLGRPILTDIRRFGCFNLAEDYHQKYYWKNFARQWERMSRGQVTEAVPDWRSEEFGRWLDAAAIPAAGACPVNT